MDLSRLTIDALQGAEDWINELAEAGTTEDVDGLVLVNTGISPQELHDYCRGPVVSKMVGVVATHEGEITQELLEVLAPAIATTYQFALVSILRAIEGD